MAEALEYLESRMKDDINIGEAAAAANCSTFHFLRMFDVVTGMGLGEYVRKRRLSLAALELAYSGSDAQGPRIIDLALDYGYESADAFARAFKREFGCLPSEARRPGRKLHTFSRLASTWAKFTSRGPLSKNFQDVIRRIYSEWFPGSGREHAGTPELEYYPDLPDIEAKDYWCEYWVPLISA
jgi:AraC-like DNA-binding protein